ncbi:hypothetical protein [Leifsonia sp. C5G2]|uniref:hypothetical protein n=1 Tax=Leifsonia sp. C5G2 TaxID=2735269 RepID=UPI001585A601|nr:hypothetical protein [Leifsonia sp. C5G2]
MSVAVPDRLLPVLVPATSLAATAGMATSAVALLPAIAAAGGLVALAAASGRRGGPAHLAVEPLGMAFMLVLAALHGRGETTALAPHGHDHGYGPGWVLPALTLAVVVLSVLCLGSALVHVLRLRPRRAHAPQDRRPSRARRRPSAPAAVLSCVSAAAMCGMTAHMLVG